MARPMADAPKPEAPAARPIDAPPACAVDPDSECPACAAAGKRVRMHPVKAHYQCPVCHYFDSCCM